MGNDNSKSKEIIFSLLEEKNKSKKIHEELLNHIALQQIEIKSLKDNASKYKGLKSRNLSRLKSQLNATIKNINSHKRWESFFAIKILKKTSEKSIRLILKEVLNRWRKTEFDPLETLSIRRSKTINWDARMHQKKVN